MFLLLCLFDFVVPLRVFLTNNSRLKNFLTCAEILCKPQAILLDHTIGDL